MLPGAEAATIDLRKLRDYCLDPGHHRGRHKARLFRAALGIGRDEAEWLRRTILAGLPGTGASLDRTDQWGTRWRVDVPIEHNGRRAIVRTFWLVGDDGGPPRLTTCYPLRREEERP